MREIVRNSAGPLLGALGYYVGAMIAFKTAWSPGGETLIWPATGFLIGALLWVRRGRRWPLIAAASITSTIANCQFGNSFISSLAYTAVNMAEAGVGALLLERFCGGRRPDFTNLRDLALFVAMAALTALLGATLAMLFGGYGLRFWQSWFLTDLLGILIVTPMTLVMLGIGRAQAPPRPHRHPLEVAALLLGVALVAAACLSQARFPLLFVPMAMLSIATYRLGTLGSLAGTLIIAASAAVAVATGSGPLQPAYPGDVVPSFFSQIYIFACFVSTMPMAAHMAAEQRLQIRFATSERFHRNLVDKSSGVLFETDVAARWRFLNPAWSTITGRSVVESLGRPALDAVEPQDRARVRAALRPLLRREVEEARFETRVAGHPPDDALWVAVTARLILHPDGKVEGSYGLIRDITDRIRVEQALADSERRHRLIAEDARRAAEEARLQADTDELTGLANRRLFLRRLEREVASAGESGRPLSIAIFDVDHFKRINDLFGHAAGDRMLRDVAGAALGAVRGGDLVGRVGGEEFAVLMPGAEPTHALAVGERIRAAVAERTGQLHDLPAVTVSVGVAFHQGLVDAQALLAQADSALYDAKAQGRDRLCLATA